MSESGEDIEWSTYANDALTVSFHQPGADGPTKISNFHPVYTEQLFGKEQRIFGYKGLEVSLRYAAHDLYPDIKISYAEKYKDVKDTKAEDLLAVFGALLPEDAFKGDFDARLQAASNLTSWKPPGELVKSYAVNGRSYEVWCGELTDPRIKELLERIQILVPFLIDGGLPLELQDQEWTLARWRVFFVYEKLSSPPTSQGSVYSICGYSTSYRFLTYQPSTSTEFKSIEPIQFPPPNPIAVSSLPNRSRISQFIILPPHQHQSHGRHLYETMITTFLNDPACIEITVEDPNEEFDDLRDFCDHARLTANGTFTQLSLNIPEPVSKKLRFGTRVPTSTLIDKSLLEQLRRKNKLAPRQYSRLVEMHLLSKIPSYSREAGPARLTQKGQAKDEGDRAYYFWRLLVKQRIYKQHRDILIQLEPSERVEKLEETLASQTQDYERLLSAIKERGSKQNENGSAPLTSRGKRKIMDDDDDDDAESEEERESKRRKESEDV